MRSDAAPKVWRFSRAIWALSFSTCSVEISSPFFSRGQLGALDDQSPLQLGGIVGQLVRREAHRLALTASLLSRHTWRPCAPGRSPLQAFQQHR